MRIISGKFRTRLIKTPRNNSIRPTSDRAREMIFNTITSLLIKDKKKITELQTETLKQGKKHASLAGRTTK